MIIETHMLKVVNFNRTVKAIFTWTLCVCVCIHYIIYLKYYICTYIRFRIPAHSYVFMKLPPNTKQLRLRMIVPVQFLLASARPCFACTGWNLQTRTWTNSWKEKALQQKTSAWLNTIKRMVFVQLVYVYLSINVYYIELYI